MESFPSVLWLPAESVCIMDERPVVYSGFDISLLWRFHPDFHT